MKQAQNRIAILVRRHVIPRANALPCKDCGHVWKKGERRELSHEYDHFKGYGINDHETVEAVCYPCHVGRHNQRHEEDERERSIVLEFLRPLLTEF